MYAHPVQVKIKMGWGKTVLGRLYQYLLLIELI